jgi:hypothetical protein
LKPPPEYTKNIPKREREIDGKSARFIVSLKCVPLAKRTRF